MTSSLSPSGDLGTAGIVATCVVGALCLILLAVELRGAAGAAAKGAAGEAGGANKKLWIAVSGVLATLALVLAVLRPVAVKASGVKVGPRVVVLIDDSRSLLLPAEKGTRADVASDVLAKLRRDGSDQRKVFLRFGEGAPRPVGEDDKAVAPSARRSDLTGAIEALVHGSDEPPSALVVVSDGRLDRPTSALAADRTALGLGSLDIPVHTVALTKKEPKDASIRSVRLAGAAVAHQPFALRVEVGCSGGLACGEVPVKVRELLDRDKPETLAAGQVRLDGAGQATVELSITLHRAGPRVIEVAIDPPGADSIADNDRRLITLDVARDRVRVLHIAGRPTYDVRAFRDWLKADASVDVVAFFILRTPTDSVGATSNELALIPFPVDELFTVHLKSFDAIVLQDFNAATYGLTKHLANLRDYVRDGGGLIMVGGPDAFGPGMYAGTQIAEALPVKLDPSQVEKGVDTSWFTPQLTPAGKVAPVLEPLRQLIGDTFPDMPGTNIVGRANPGATVLLSHPSLKDGEPMPVLALGEFGTGRTIALTIDGTHRLLFSAFAAEQAGRAYGALWDGLLGWLMRDPRFESTRIGLAESCVAGLPSHVNVTPLPGHQGTGVLEIYRLGKWELVHSQEFPVAGDGSVSSLDVPALPAGGYSISVRVNPKGVEAGAGASLTPATRRDFACETGGDEWADPRPDPERLAAIAKATGGVALSADALDELPSGKPTFVSTQRESLPILPPWGWTTIAAALAGLHWFVRRRSGLV